MNNKEIDKINTLRAVCRSSIYKINEMEGQLKSLRVNIEGFENEIKTLEVNSTIVTKIEQFLKSNEIDTMDERWVANRIRQIITENNNW